MTQDEKFFYEHAGFGYDPRTETPHQGRIRCAKRLATAEKHAKEMEWEYEWELDDAGCIGCDCGSEDCACSTGEPHETLVCILRDPNPEACKTCGHRGNGVLASLGGICGATDEYRRVVEAELALEAM